MSKFSKGDIVRCKKTGQYYEISNFEPKNKNPDIFYGYKMGTISRDLYFLFVENIELYEEGDEKV